MVERNDYPPGVPCWVDTLQPDVDGAMRFYGDLMGWTFEGPGEMPDVPSGRYYVARLRGRDVAGIGTRPPEISGTVKNLGLLGGALLIAYFGAGPVSIAERADRPEATPARAAA
jgi:hypothetical protein